MESRTEKQKDKDLLNIVFDKFKDYIQVKYKDSWDVIKKDYPQAIVYELSNGTIDKLVRGYIY